MEKIKTHQEWLKIKRKQKTNQKRGQRINYTSKGDWVFVLNILTQAEIEFKTVLAYTCLAGTVKYSS